MTETKSGFGERIIFQPQAVPVFFFALRN